MANENQIMTIEATIRNIFYKDKITTNDVFNANNLFYKWKLLTGYIEDSSYPLIVKIIDEIPNYKPNK